MIRTLIFLAVFVVLAVGMAYSQLRYAKEAHQQSNWAWMRYYLTICHIWTAVAIVLGAIAVGALK